ncbi:hypothetical protein FQA39_LY00631 [Lamprigera yunnana]|nr:hypothetical protein FQA39_LY00631 [Lamprigera yunnana]
MYLYFYSLMVSTVFFKFVLGCQFYPPGEYLRFARVPENLTVGEEILKITVHPRRNLNLIAIDKSDDVHYFSYREINSTTISLVLKRSLDDLVDTQNPQNVLKFKLVCDYDHAEDMISSFLSVTVYVEDVNDHAPVFTGTPYYLTVDELTPVGLTIFRRIQATDRDKPNTPNSDVQYAITAGNDRGIFALGGSHQAFLVLKKSLDYDSGDYEFLLTVTASDRGIPQRSTNATVKITVQDADDLSPKFTKGVYRTKLAEFYPLTGEKIHHRLRFEPTIFAYDQDLAIDTPIRYDILAGNDRHLFYLDHVNGSLFLEREIDLEAEGSLPGNTFVLQIQATQINAPQKTGVARIEIEILDLNDNLPEFQVDSYNISIVENLPNGFSVLQIIAKDADQGDNGEFVFAIEDKSGAFRVDRHSGWLTVRNNSVLDREKRSSIVMRAYAKEKTFSVITNKLDSSSVPIEVTLLDVNDNNPTFIPSNIYNLVSFTNRRPGEVIGQVHTFDPDLGINGLVQYQIQRTGNNANLFNVDSRTGQIFVTASILMESKHTLLIEASDSPVNPSEKRFSVAVVTVNIKSMNDSLIQSSSNYPEFIGAPYEFWIGYKVAIGTAVGQIRILATDKKKILFDLLHSYKEGVPFAIEEKLGTITVIDQLNKYNRTAYDFEAIAINEDSFSIVSNVTIHIVNPDNDAKSFMRYGESTKLIEFRIKENKLGALIGKVGNHTLTPFLKFTIANQRDVTDYISISSDGSLYTQKSLDREKRDMYRLTIIVECLKDAIKSSEIYQIAVYVDDENDNAPAFDHQIYEGHILENCNAGTEVILNQKVSARDEDIGANGHFVITIFGNGGEMFRLDRHTGRVHFHGGRGSIDREEMPLYNLRLVAKDDGGLYGEAKLIIKIDDTNDNAPKFTKLYILPNRGIEVVEYNHMHKQILLFQEKVTNTSSGIHTLTQTVIKPENKSESENPLPLFSIQEDAPVGIAIFRLEAEDLDLNENAIIKYEMMSETYIPNSVLSSNLFHVNQHFMVHPNSGEIFIARSLPAESEFRLNVVASDKDNLKDNFTLRLYVADVNDHPPVFRKPWYTFDIEESTYTNKTLGNVDATDADFGQNANISYRIQFEENQNTPFIITPFEGVLKINGELDREKKDKYLLTVIASDSPKMGKKLFGTVTVEIHVLDVNDNPPLFYGYDDVATNRLTNFDTSFQTPVYFAHISGNAPIGTFITKVFANDSDFVGNGNGLFLFSLLQNEESRCCFSIDSKTGVITTIAKLGIEHKNLFNITVIASDLGSPSLSSSAVVMINLVTIQDDVKNTTQIFEHRYYEIEIEENVQIPLEVITLRVTSDYRHRRLRYSIVGNKNSETKKIFKIDPRNGTIFMISSPDREKRSLYEFTVRLDEYKVSRDMTVMVYPVTNERLGELGLNEVKVVVRITDVNDNEPKFLMGGKPIVTAIPTNANYGYEVLKLQATDADYGINSEIRYQILGNANEVSRRFTIDQRSGQIKTISSFSKDSGRVFGFDVKATDRNGADDGKSAIANVLVYILDERQQLIMVMDTSPIEVERNLDNLTSVLYNITGYDIRVRKLEPHFIRNELDNKLTDIYLYGVDPLLNVVVEVQKLQKILQLKKNEIEEALESHKVLAFTTNIPDSQKTKARPLLLSTLEVGVVILGCFVLVCSFLILTCVLLYRHKKKRLIQQNYVPSQHSNYALSSSELSKSILFPSNFEEAVQYSEPRRDVTKLSNADKSHADNYARNPRNSMQIEERSRRVGGIETSLTSLHSSGKDSGIIDGGHHCPCGQTSSQTSEESCNSNYEDSLNSEKQSKPNDKAVTSKYEIRRSSRRKQRLKRSKTLTGDTNQRTPTVAFLNPYTKQNRVTNPRLISTQIPSRLFTQTLKLS